MVRFIITSDYITIICDYITIASDDIAITSDYIVIKYNYIIYIVCQITCTIVKYITCNIIFNETVINLACRLDIISPLSARPMNLNSLHV